MSSEITIAVAFIGVIVLAISAAACTPMARLFVCVISTLGAFLIIMTWGPIILAPALIVTFIFWLMVILIRSASTRK